ncbi:Rossmann-like and DUF2520 domain-containing protein [Caulobacter sp. UNC358MFTsu5.1]|uniref:Rossmann-like and DUF2520 domain-containing protein n=1 Tax=Caulobacter sp. UNC358MFTsu5.1 TaxID=1449049 RepID=UPI00068F6D05|nr:Rossmann-like and DUF2520 domain-containing protein [Caulobacter sp. UNC358MFTsu5.1]
MSRLWIIGPGAVGRTLGRLFHDRGVFAVSGIVGRTREGAEAARAFIGGGQAADAATPTAGDVVMISTRDGEIDAVAAALADGVDPAGLVVFHCSGARDLAPLEPLRRRGAAVAALHPVKAFADPAREVATFDGVVCTLQGDAAALAVLAPAVAAIGGAPVVLPQGVDRRLYHAGTVFASNYLAALVQAGLDAHAAAGIDGETALKILSPILRDALGAILDKGPVAALTGPIARGDAATVAAQVEALAARDAGLAELHAALGRKTVELARRKTPGLALGAVEEVLDAR